MKETLTIEYLPAFKMYRVWNYYYEGYFETRRSLIGTCLEIKEDFNFVTYGTTCLIKQFKKNGLILEKGE